jgi:hypothetical protein
MSSSAPAEAAEGQGDCSDELPTGFDPQPYLGHAEFERFRNDVQPVLEGCSAGNCHGAPQADFHVTCGDDDQQLAFNFSQMWAFVDDPVDNSQVLRCRCRGREGEYHSGGALRRAAIPTTWVRDWAMAVGRLEFGEGDPGKQFFAANVQRCC